MVIISGTLNDILDTLHRLGKQNRYIYGGLTSKIFLKEDLIEKMIIATIPAMLDDGISLFGTSNTTLNFEHISTEVILGATAQSHYKRSKA